MIGTLSVIPLVMTIQAAANSSEPKAVTPFDFQGVTLGQSLSEWMGDHPNAKCEKGKILWETVCPGEKPAFITTYGGVEYHFYSYDQSKPAVLYEIGIIASRNDRAAILSGLQGKWGSPASTDGVITKWQRAGSTINYYDLGNGVSVRMRLDDVAEAFSKAVESQAAKDF